MKVIQISSFYKPSVGGVERQVEEISQHLIQKGIEVEVWTTDASHKELRIKNYDLRIDKDEVKVHRFKFWLKFGHFFRFSPILLIKLLFTKFDVIHVHNSHDAHLLGAILIKIIRRKKLVLTGHNPYIVGSEKRGEKLNNNVKFFDKVLKIFARFIDTYIALLNSEKEFVSQYLKIPAEKIAVIPNGIRDIFFQETTVEQQPRDPKYKLIVGTISRIDFVKGIQNLKYAADNLPEVQFLFTGGDGGYLSTLKELYKDNKNVYFNGEYISPEDAKQFFNYIDIFLLPSVYEPFGITIVEAMTQNKFILASDTAGPREIVHKEFGELIQNDDQQKWYERIKYYLEHPDEIQQKGIQAGKFAEQYKWENVISKIIDVYNSV